MAIRPGVVAIATMDWFEANAPVILDSVEPLRLTSGLEVVGARVSFVVKKGVHGFKGFPGVFCTDRWPPKRLVDLVEPEGLEVADGDQIAVTFFTRAAGRGDFDVAGLRIRYRQDGRLREQTTESSTVTVLARTSDEEFPPGTRCPPDVPSHWLGDLETHSTEPRHNGHDVVDSTSPPATEQP